MAVTIGEIVRFFGDEPNAVKKGEDAVNHVTKIMYAADLKNLQGVVQASMRNRSYNVKIDFDGAGSVQHSNCTCPRGNYKCHHMAAVMIYAHKNISSTTADCQWSKVKTVEGDEPQKAEDNIPPGKQYRATNTPLNEEDIKKAGESEHINLKVLGQDNKIVQFGIKKHTPLRKLMNAYCDRLGLATAAVRFRFGGQPINEADTPLTLEMEEGDTIEVYQRQIG